MREGGSSSLGKGREGREERNLELEIDKLLYTKKPLKPPPRRKKSAMYTVRQLGMGWKRKQAWGKVMGVWFNNFMVIYSFIYLFNIFSFRDSGKGIFFFSCLGHLKKEKEKTFKNLSAGKIIFIIIKIRFVILITQSKGANGAGGRLRQGGD